MSIWVDRGAIMLEEPRCYARKCRWFLGVGGDPDSEINEVPICAAFPQGIPAEIAYGDNLHIEPFPGDGGFMYVRESDD